MPALRMPRRVVPPLVRPAVIVAALLAAPLVVAAAGAVPQAADPAVSDASAPRLAGGGQGRAPKKQHAVLIGAGDISTCGGSGDAATAKLVNGIAGTVFTTGDNAYPNGSISDYATCYDPTWGAFKSRTRPAPGNHEYQTAGAAGYFSYFGSRAGVAGTGYYAYDLGAWRIYVLNSNCSSVPCGSTSAQVSWLKADLAAHPKACVLAYWHHPLFSSGMHGNSTSVRPFWEALYVADAEVVLNGHDHSYERFAPMTPSGTATSAGLREFVVGTGGASHYAFGTVKPNSVARNATTYGVLKVTLRPGSYDWQFVPETGKTYTDTGSGSCH